MSVELKVPAVGESITEVQISQWLKAEGDAVAKDENLVEIETDKATVELPAPVAGTVVKVLKRAGETATVGEVIGYMEEAAVASRPRRCKRSPRLRSAVRHRQGRPKIVGSIRSPGASARLRSMRARLPADAASNRRSAGRSPRSWREHGLKPADVKPTGPGGRVV